MPDSTFVGRLAPWVYDEATACTDLDAKTAGKIKVMQVRLWKGECGRMVARKTDFPDDPEAAAAPADDSTRREQDSITPNPYVAFTEMFADDSFADEVDAYIAAERRQHEEAVAQAGE